MKILFNVSVALLLIGAGQSVFAANAVSMPAGAIQAGSFANPKLQQQVSPALIAEITTRGCQKAEGYHPFVMRMPSGAQGARTWEEQWVVDGCGNTYPVTIDFSEDGTNAASFQIVAPNK
jgi:hypothetical protein